ncbi:hypothetical protein H2202_000940 [Exophiala xenobiotica]|nr:hypothetical protein H2202_000940 [Exophiala xenobiotica]KAK5241669.1 hypothetical protein LTS06_011979 [Exophiala xenobiotica]
MSLSMPEVIPGDGFGLELLTGQANYSRWARGFRIVALSKGLWRVFDSQNQKEEYTVRSTHHETRLAAEQGLALLLLWVHPALRSKIEHQSKPRAAWNVLKICYKMDADLAIQFARLKARSLRLQDCENMADYLNQHQLVFQDHMDAGDPRELKILVKCIVDGLGPKYTNFLEGSEIKHHIDWSDIPALTGQLLLFEYKLGMEERMNKEVEAEAKSTSAVEAEAKSTAELAVKAAVEPAVKSAVEAEAKSTAELAVKAAVEPAVKSAVEAEAKSTVELAVKAAVEVEVKSAVEQAVKAAVIAEVKRTVEAKVKSALVAEVKSIVEPAVKAAVEAEVKSVVEAEVKSIMKAKVKSAVEARRKSTIDAGKDNEADWEQV